jgi:hypothetical protein
LAWRNLRVELVFAPKCGSRARFATVAPAAFSQGVLIQAVARGQIGELYSIRRLW